MKNYIKIDNKKIEISDETANNLKQQFGNGIEPTPSGDIGIDYEMMGGIDWYSKEEILITDEPNNKIFYNQKFADNSKFGDNCVFMKCKFGSYCEFGSYCKFDSFCEFGSYCEFGSNCKFDSYCKFGSCCKFGYGCIKNNPYWIEDCKHE